MELEKTDLHSHSDSFIAKIGWGCEWKVFDHKMSKSDPDGAILLHDSPKALRKKIQKHAYLDPSDLQSPVYELAEHVVLPEWERLL